MTRGPPRPRTGRYAGQEPRGPNPKRGLFKLQLVKNGPYVPCAINYGPALDPDRPGVLLDRSWHYSALINGDVQGDISPAPSEEVWMIWHHGVEITQAEYDHLFRLRVWALTHNHTDPAANPNKPIDLDDLPSLI